MLLYHRTTAERAQSILTEGFRDSRFDAEDGMERGIWFSEDPQEWALGSPALLVIEMPDELLCPTWRSKLYPIEWQIPSRCLRELAIETFRVL